jgi:hypothetical protein
MSAQTGFPVVICPGCNLQMTPEASEAAPTGVNKTTYRCPSCGTQTQRIFKTDINLPLSPTKDRLQFQR